SVGPAATRGAFADRRTRLRLERLFDFGLLSLSAFPRPARRWWWPKRTREAQMFDSIVKKFIGTKNQRELNKLKPLVARVNELEPQMKALKDEDFARQTAEWKEQVAKGRPLDELLPEA